MSLSSDLLEQARHLASRERRRPRQASLRRAISTAYYGLFHLLVAEASRAFAPGTALAGIRGLSARAFDHGEMRDASRAFGAGMLPAHVATAVGVASVPADLRVVATAFVQLQQVRHEADYDVARRFGRHEAQIEVVRAEQAAAAWSRLREDPAARAYLLALLLWRRWRR